jgi:hypothetical protein
MLTLRARYWLLAVSLMAIFATAIFVWFTPRGPMHRIITVQVVSVREVSQDSGHIGHPDYSTWTECEIVFMYGEFKDKAQAMPLNECKKLTKGSTISLVQVKNMVNPKSLGQYYYFWPK